MDIDFENPDWRSVTDGSVSVVVSRAKAIRKNIKVSQLTPQQLRKVSHITSNVLH